MGLISARLDDEDEKVLRRAKVNFSELFRRAAHEEARRVLALQALDDLARMRAKAKPAKVSSQQIVRELRDAD